MNSDRNMRDAARVVSKMTERLTLMCAPEGRALVNFVLENAVMAPVDTDEVPAGTIECAMTIVRAIGALTPTELTKLLNAAIESRRR